jgi:predicted ATP-binding protein involved in virulence
MTSIPIYLKSIALTNIKTFVDQSELELTKADGTLAQWTLILGDNGIGKSTLLQFIAWMIPNFSNYKPAPLLDAEENQTLEHLVHRGKNITNPAVASAVFIANQRLNSKAGPSVSKCETRMSITLNESGKLDKVGPQVKASKRGVFYKEEINIYAYSASRQLGKLNVSSIVLSDMVPSFVQEKTELYDAEEILRTLHHASLGLKSLEEQKRYTVFLERVEKMMVALLPDFEKIEDIEIGPIQTFSDDQSGGVTIKTKHGNKIPFNDFSLGYKSVASWTIDLAYRFFSKYHHTENPLAEPAIVLIDELDLHLHPLWQQRIMANLTDHFPNTQFIATAHSPLMVQEAVRSNYAVLRFEGSGVKIENRPEGIDGWRVDQILTSELFDLRSARGIEYDDLMQEREQLLKKRRLSHEQKSRLSKLETDLFDLPTSETPAELNNREFLTQLVDKIKKNTQ